jgi:ubiquinone/menaquinone biosynthesis C-methylase UbiE
VLTGFKKKILALYNWPYVSKDVADARQKFIRNYEWAAISRFIRPGRFLDVGCGAGYAMKRAEEDFSSETSGIDPDPGAHGVGRYNEGYIQPANVLKGFSENLPYDNKSFDTVYSSHVLEHVNDVSMTLKEMNRVMKDDGVLIIGMPTATMAFMNGLTPYLLTTHHRIVISSSRGLLLPEKAHLRRYFSLLPIAMQAIVFYST